MAILVAFEMKVAIKPLYALSVLGVLLLTYLSVLSYQFYSEVESLETQKEIQSAQLTAQANDLLEIRETQVAQAIELNNSDITQSSMQSIINSQATQIATLEFVPEINSIDDLPACDFNKSNFPCIYYVQVDINPNKVAIDAYGDKKHQDRVKEFYRDKNGDIPTWIVGKFTILPSLTNRNIDYYNNYFKLLNILECNEQGFSPPCWYVSFGEPYEVLAENYYNTQDVIKCIEKANKIEYNKVFESLRPITIKSNDVLILPICK